MDLDPEQRLAEQLRQLNLELPPAPAPKGLYRPLVTSGHAAFLAGHLPVRPDGSIVIGRLGADLDIAAGQAAAQLTGLGMIATLRGALGSLKRVRRLLKLLGMVNCTPEFEQQPAVLNGCSQLLADIFGPDAGIGVRSAVGVAALPLGAAVEIEAIFETE